MKAREMLCLLMVSLLLTAAMVLPAERLGEFGIPLQGKFDDAFSWSSATKAFFEKGISPYNAEALGEYQRTQGWKGTQAFANQYPLTTILLWFPMSLLPLSVSWVVWTYLNIMFILLGTQLTLYWFKIPENKRHLALLGSVLYLPTLRMIINGQWGGFIFFFTVIGLWAVRKRWGWLTGFSAALLILSKPPNTFLIAPTLLILALRDNQEKSRSTLFGFLIPTVGSLMVSVYLYPNWINDWSTSIRLLDQFGGPWGASLPALFWNAGWYKQPMFVGAFLILATLWIVVINNNPNNQLIMATILLQALTSPRINGYDLSLFLLILFWWIKTTNPQSFYLMGIVWFILPLMLFIAEKISMIPDPYTGILIRDGGLLLGPASCLLLASKRQNSD